MQTFFQEAANEALKSSYKLRLGAIVVQKNKIVGRGHNVVHSTGVLRESTHAEMSAINNTKARYRGGSVLFVSRLGSGGELLLAKPCARCEKVLRKLGVRRVWYSSSEEWKLMKL